jgi:hypothetical protein
MKKTKKIEKKTSRISLENKIILSFLLKKRQVNKKSLQKLKKEKENRKKIKKEIME